MSLPTSSSSKKRKHGEVAENSAGSSHKKVKKDGKEKKSKGKGKSKKMDPQFQVVNASVLVSIPPKFSLNPLSGALEMLDSLIMKYVPALRGVMLCHSNAKFVSDTAVLKYECPFSNCTVSFDATVWSPQIGMKLTGRINLCSPDHISLLVNQTFNVSIPREHIPTDSWVYEVEYGAAENDPEFGPHAVGMDGEEAQEGLMDVDDGNPTNNAEEPEEREVGVWVHKATGEKLGGKDGQLEFTVIGLTVANQMLSLKGSIQPDPFSPEHVPQPAVRANAETAYDDDAEEAKESQYPNNLNEDSDLEEEDPFRHLNQVREKAEGRDATEKEREKDKKTKEKEEKKQRKKEKKERKEKEKALAPASTNETVGTEVTVEDIKSPKKKRKKSSQEA